MSPRPKGLVVAGALVAGLCVGLTSLPTQASATGVPAPVGTPSVAAAPSSKAYFNITDVVVDTRANEYVITGTAQPNASVVLDAHLFGTPADIFARTTASGTGRFELKVDRAKVDAYPRFDGVIDATAPNGDSGALSEFKLPLAARFDAPPASIPATGFTLTGRADDLSDVMVYDGSTLLGSARPMGSEFSFAVPALSAGTHVLTVKQRYFLASFDWQSSITVAVGGGGQTQRPLVVTSPTTGSTYVAGPVTFRGTATPGATIKAVNQWGTPFTPTSAGITAGATGEWSFTRTLGPTADYSLTLTQNGTSPTTLTLKGPAATGKRFAVTSHTTGGTYTPGVVTFRGTSAANATIKAVNQWGTSFTPTTAGIKANAQGDWSFSRSLGPTADYSLTFTENGGSPIAVQLTAAISTTRPLTVTSHTNGGVYTPGVVVFRGTASPNATIEAVNQWGTVMTPSSAGITADALGNWSFSRSLGPTAAYTITFTQNGSTPTSISLTARR